MQSVCGSTGSTSSSLLDVRTRSCVLLSAGTSSSERRRTSRRDVQEEPPSPNTVNATVSCAITAALDLVMKLEDDNSSYGASSCEDSSPDDDLVEEEANDEGYTPRVRRNELLKDNMSRLYNELARLRVGRREDDLSSACSSDEESDWDEEEEEEDDHHLCFLLGRRLEYSSSSDLLVNDSSLFVSRYGGISPEQ